MSNTILLAALGSGVAVLLYIFDCIRRSGLKLHDKIDAISAEMRAGFNQARAEREAGFKEARAEREAGFKEARADREKIRAEMRTGFKEARADREKIRAEMRDGFKEARTARDNIRAEMIAGFGNQNATFNRVFDRINSVRKDVPTDISIRFEGVQHDFRVVRQDISSTNGNVTQTNERIDKLSQALLAKGIILHPV